MKGYHDSYTEYIGAAWLVVALLLGTVGLILTTAGCAETYTVYNKHADGSITRTDLTVEHDIPETIGEPEFMSLRAEEHYDQTGKYLGGRVCEQNYKTLKCVSQ